MELIVYQGRQTKKSHKPCIIMSCDRVLLEKVLLSVLKTGDLPSLKGQRRLGWESDIEFIWRMERHNHMKGQGGRLKSEDRFKCPRCVQGMRRGGWGRAQPAKRPPRERDRDQIRWGLVGYAELSCFYSKSNGQSTDLSRGMPWSDFHSETITLPPVQRTHWEGTVDELLWSRLEMRVAWIKVKALEKWEEMKRIRLV